LGLGLLFATGCGDSSVATVHGTVKVDGELAQQGSIAFIPVDGMGATAGGKIVAGEYEAEVPLGTKKVEIRVNKKVGETKLYDTPDSPVAPIFEEVLPKKYHDQTELTYDVVPGEQQNDFDLSTK